MANLVAPPAGVQPWAWVLCRGERLWHQRRVWGRSASPPAEIANLLDVLISTADHDEYQDSYAPRSIDIVAARFCATRQALQGVGPNRL